MPETYRKWHLPQLWDMVADERVDSASVHLTTLRRQQIALEAQRDHLRALRDQLIVAWPPEKSEAAMVFINRIDDMIRAMEVTARCAADLRTGVGQVVEALGEARETLEPLVAQYEKAADPRVRRQAQRLLDDRARRVLMATDTRVGEVKMEVGLPAYESIRGLKQPEPLPGANGGNGPAHSSKSAGSGGGFIPPRFDPPAPSVEFELAGSPGDDGARGSGPSSAGMQIAGSVSTHGQAGPAVIGGAERGLPNTARAANQGEMRGVIGGPGYAPPPSRLGGAQASPVTSARPLRPGSSAMPSTGASPGRSTARPGAYRDRSYEEYTARRRTPQRDSDESWSVQEGVTPVLEAPTTEVVHDPGPGVLGIDR